MKKIAAILMAMFMALSVTACDDSETVSTDAKGVETTVQEEIQETKNVADVQKYDNVVPLAETDTEWVVYWYLCGSDLESNYGAATNDLAEMFDVDLPENVQVVIQTGGAAEWHNDIVSADKLQRFVYTSEGLGLVEEVPLASMGDAATLESFLRFARTNFPGKRTAVVIWNHGNGSVYGAAFDELYGNDSLLLPEMQQAFGSVFGEDKTNQPVDIIGFDTCLMATVDVANTFSGIGKYLVASEEVEPGNGWLYSGWLGAIAENPTIEPLQLSKAICDTYVEGCQAVGTEENITLSVTNLSKVDQLLTAYDQFGREALAAAVEDSAFFAHFAQGAAKTENYGGNTREQGYTNMTDLGHLAYNTAALLPSASAVQTALDACMEYKVNGKYRPDAKGLSCYYSYSADYEDLLNYAKVGVADAFKYYFEYSLTGTLQEGGMAYLEKLQYDTLPEIQTLETMGWEDKELVIDEEGSAKLILGEEAINILSSITFELYYADIEEDVLICLGTDNDLFADWETGVFQDNFRGVWGSLDDAFCYMEISAEGEDYNLYSVPILLNDEEYNMIVAYDFNTAEYSIQGARKPVGESGAADKNVRYFVEGDVIQTIHYGMIMSEDAEEYTAVAIDTIIVSEDMTFTEAELGDGLFIMMYAMEDSQGNKVYSQPATFEIADGEIYTYLE